MRTTRAVTLIGVLLMAASARGAPPVATVEPATAVSGNRESQPPPGSSADQDLWRSGFQTQTGSISEQEKTRRLMNRLRAAKYYDRLEAVAKAAPESAPRTRELTKTLSADADGAYQQGANPPFNLRIGCRNKLLRFGQQMSAKPGTEAASNLVAARQELVACRDALQRWRGPLMVANDKLQRSLGELDTFLAQRESNGPAAAPPTAKAAASPTGL